MSFDVSFFVKLIDQFTGPADKIANKAKQLGEFVGGFGEGAGQALREFDATRLDAAIDAADKRVASARQGLLGAVALAVALGAPIRAAMRFEESFAGVAKVLDVSDARLAQLRQNALKMSGDLGIAAQSVNAIMEQAASGGTPTDELEAFTAFTAKASVAFDMLAGDVANAFAEIRNLYKVNQQGLEDVSDAANHLSNNLAARASDIIDFVVRGQGAADVLKLNAV